MEEEEPDLEDQEEQLEAPLTLGDSNPEESASAREEEGEGKDKDEEEEEEMLDADDDPGYEIVTEDKGTNCPSLQGSLRKLPKTRQDRRGEDQIREVEEEDGKPPAAPKRQNKRWSKLMKYTLPSKTPETKPKKETKERKSLKDKMKENDFVVFLTERRAVSESRFRVLDKIGSPGKLTRTKSDQVRSSSTSSSPSS